MSGWIKRALGYHVAAIVDGLHVFSDKEANKDRLFPDCYITDIAHVSTPSSCGVEDFTTKNKAGEDETTYKLYDTEYVFRLTVRAPDGPDMAGQERVRIIIDALIEALRDAAIDESEFSLTDEAVDPPAVFPVHEITATTRQSNLPPEVAQRPFLYQEALSVRVSLTEEASRAVDAVMNEFKITPKGEDS